MPHQLYALSRLSGLESHALWLQMSLGKTSIVLSHIERSVRWLTKTLVIAPPYVAQTVWPAEARKWEHLRDLKVVVVSGTASERERILSEDADVYCISRNHIQWIFGQYTKTTKSGGWRWRRDRPWPFGYVVLDEAANFKDPDGTWFMYLRRIRKTGATFVNLTGTPAPNGLLDIWAQTYLLDLGASLGESMTAYKMAHFRPAGYRDTPRGLVPSQWAPIDPEAIYGLLAGNTTSMRTSDWALLPDVMYQTTEIDLPMAARVRYNQMRSDGVLNGADWRISAGNGGVKGQKLLQIANGACYDDERYVVPFHDAKLDALEARMEEADTPVIVFISYQHDKDRILRKFPYAEQMRGAETIVRWCRREIRMLVAHPQEIGHGLNLQEGGRHIIWFGPTYNLGDYQQGNSRLIRVGQEGIVTVDHIVARGTRDMDILPVLMDKDATQADLMEALAYGNT